MDAQPEQYSPIIWRTSRYTADQHSCVEIAVRRASILVRDSKDRDGAILEVAPARWEDFLGRIRNGIHNCA
jgi:hypothetical protein